MDEPRDRQGTRLQALLTLPARWKLPGRLAAAALAGQDLKAAVSVFSEIAEKGQADLVITLSGNNERGVPKTRAEHRPQAETDAIVASLRHDYRLQLSRLVEIAERSGLLTYVLTVPVNLRDWVPVGPVQPDHARIRQLLQQGDPEAALSLLGEAPENLIRSYLKGRAFEALGAFEEVTRAYSLARDQDGIFRRARSRWNTEVLALEQGPSVQALDMERRLATE